MKALAPAGNFLHPKICFNAQRKFAQTEAHLRQTLTDQLKARFAAEQVYFFGSGREALYAAFSRLKTLIPARKLIAMPAFTCPDVAAAAVRAGFSIFPLDVTETLQSSVATIDDNIGRQLSAVVLTNLYGTVDALAPWMELAKRHDFLVIDDAAQAARSIDQGKPVGGRGADMGILSFGRGKAFCGIGGGALLMNHPELKIQAYEKFDCAPLKNFSKLILALLYYYFEKPALYGLASHLPGLGQTVYEENFSFAPLTSTQAIYALAHLNTDTPSTENIPSLWQTALENLPLKVITAPGLRTRLPVLCNSAADRNLLAAKLKSQGVSESYARTLFAFPALKPHLVPTNCVGAEELAGRLLTLPVHAYVTAGDVEEIAAAIKLLLKK